MTKKAAASDEGKVDRPKYRYLASTIAAGLWLLLAVALVSHDPADAPGHTVAPYHPEPQNWAGHVGAIVSYKLYLVLGQGVWIVMAAYLALLVAILRRRPVTQPALRTLGVLLLSIATSALVGLSMPQLGDNPQGSGGLLAIFINHELIQRFSTVGTWLILTVGFWLGAILAMDQILVAAGRSLNRWVSTMSQLRVPRPVLVGTLTGWRNASRHDSMLHTPVTIPLRRDGRRIDEENDEHIDEEAGGLGATKSFDPDSHNKRDRNAAVVDLESEQEDEPVDDEVEAELDEDSDAEEVGAHEHDAPGTYVQQKQFDPEALRAKIKKLPINFAPKAKHADLPSQREVDLSGYRFPSLDLLTEPESSFTEEQEKTVRDQAVQLESALQQYRIKGEVVGIDSGPVITLYEVRLAPGTKVSQINAISSDIARALRAQNIRVVPNMVGKDTVGVEVPNLKKEKVRLKELMTVNPEVANKMKLPMFLAKDASGNPVIADLATMPHMLIAGTTGSGKSVCINSIIVSFLYTKRPDELKLVLVDPKMVELSMFRDIPHLMCPVVTEMPRATATLEWATTKMDERYELLAEAGVRDVTTYNSLGSDELLLRFNPPDEAEAAKIPRKLPYIVFIIDELADLIITNKEVEHFVVRLAQKARAVGIHLILATQRPQANVVTGLIKSNMPCRVSFKVASGMDSRIVLDQKGAELLLGQGDMLFRSPRTSKITRAQGTLVDDLEVRKITKFLTEIAQQSFEPQLMQLKAEDVAGSDLDYPERDPLFDEAVQIVLESRRGSVSLLQRRLTIGYSRASRLIEQMAEAGIIGEYKGSQAREVMVTVEEWEAIRAQAEADARAAEFKQIEDGPSAEQDQAEEAYETNDDEAEGDAEECEEEDEEQDHEKEDT